MSGLLICAVVMGAPPDRIDNWSTRRDTFPMRARPSYQHEPFHLREAIWSRGYMTALQMLRIAAWKSARGLALLTLNDEDLIRLRTADAFDAIRPWRAADVLNAPVDWDAWREMVAHAVGSKQGQTGLLALEGVGYPMASAFLALLAPAAFPVIDRWAVHGVYGPTIGNYQTSLVHGLRPSARSPSWLLCDGQHNSRTRSSSDDSGDELFTRPAAVRLLALRSGRLPRTRLGASPRTRD